MNNTKQIPYDDFRMLCDLRAELEIFSVRQICRTRNQETVQSRLAPILQQMQKAAFKKNYAEFMHEDQMMHRTIIALAEFPTLLTVWETVWEALAQFHHDSFEQYWPDLRILMREHEYLISTICSMDLSAAEDSTHTHLQAIWFRIAGRKDKELCQENPLSRAVSYIAFNLQHPLLLKQIATEVAFTSPGHLSKLFRDRYGKSFQMYVQETRLDKAATLFQQTDLPVSTIARRVGYQDVSRFGQHFKRRFGLPPFQWKQHNRKYNL